MNEEVWGRRFVKGVCILMSLIILLLLIGTESGRHFLVVISIILTLIFILGYSGEILYEGYKEYL